MRWSLDNLSISTSAVIVHEIFKCPLGFCTNMDSLAKIKAVEKIRCIFDDDYKGSFCLFVHKILCCDVLCL